jgi:hypothetical protein
MTLSVDAATLLQRVEEHLACPEQDAHVAATVAREDCRALVALVCRLAAERDQAWAAHADLERHMAEALQRVAAARA